MVSQKLLPHLCVGTLVMAGKVPAHLLLPLTQEGWGLFYFMAVRAQQPAVIWSFPLQIM